MSQKTEDRPNYNLRPRNNKGIVIPEKITENVGDGVTNEILDDPLEEEMDYGDEVIEEEIELDIPESVINDINLAIQNLVQEVTEDIVDKISEIVVTSVENNLEEHENVEDDEDEDDSEYKPSMNNDMFKFLEEGVESMGLYTNPRKKMLLSKNRWQKDLTPEEIEKYRPIFDEYKIDNKLSLPMIIRSNLSELEKEKAIKKYINSHPSSASCKEIVETITHREKNPISPEKLVQMDELEKQLSHVKENRSGLKEKIYNLSASIEQKSSIYEKYLQFETLGSSSAESTKLREWLNWAIRLPWDKNYKLPDLKNDNETSVAQFMENIKKKLSAVYGLKNAKEEIMMFVLKRLINSADSANSQSKTSLGGQILAIEGAPGVGKTYLLKHLASALNIPFESIPLGGCKDASFLDGHGYTYEGSLPGRIVQALKNMQCNNGIIYFDEIDKLSESQHGQEVSALMLHILDPSQNKEFFDKYIGDIPIDLSKIFFVLSINDRNKIDHVLRQRLFIIKIPDPTVKDKIEIAKQCMIPNIEKEFGFNPGDIVFSRETLNYIINCKTNKEKGVRNFKHLLLAIYKRLLFIREVGGNTNELNVSFWINDFKLPYTILPETVVQLLKDVDQTSGMDENIKKLYL